jgi:hypothetical protein
MKYLCIAPLSTVPTFSFQYLKLYRTLNRPIKMDFLNNEATSDRATDQSDSELSSALNTSVLEASSMATAGAGAGDSNNQAGDVVTWQNGRWLGIDHAANKRPSTVVSKIWTYGKEYCLVTNVNQRA